MKQTIKIILISSLLGTLLAGLFFLSIKNKAEAKTIPTLYAYQVGVYKNYDNALKAAENYFCSKIVKEKDLYRVFIGITKTNKEFFSHFYDTHGYNYYIKEIPVQEDFEKKIKKYDALLLETSEEAQEKVIATMLESFPDEL